MKRLELAREVLSGYVSGPAAATQATARALEKVGDARAIVLIEGISDQIAVETLAVRRGLDLDADGVLILPIGGAQAILRYLLQLGPRGTDMDLAGLCDVAEEEIIRRSLAKAGLGAPKTRADMERLGFFVCVDDLESEMIRAVGPARIEELFDSQGDLSSFRTLQKQSAWHSKSVEAQMRRYLASGSRRKLRYARLLVGSVDLDCVPHPLDAVLTYVQSVATSAHLSTNMADRKA